MRAAAPSRVDQAPAVVTTPRSVSSSGAAHSGSRPANHISSAASNRNDIRNITEPRLLISIPTLV